ncbi:hypothetical protein AK830_g8895 [Neonectria ditissima]|uniref:Xylose isomerase-like TIM barrel domain-containing protein n=1 Tax=Neonectria ditissima TaxID=78410 RepID=A0A0P7BB43_9HYPO|nr:hypothetical protein AK830_g8895 [Neonectria ditissima]
MGIYYPYYSAVIPISLATCSIGSRYGVTLPEKLKAIQKAGFDAVELTLPDVLAYGSHLNGHDLVATDFSAIAIVAKAIRSLVLECNLQVLMLKPFDYSEGWRSGQSDKTEGVSVEKVQGWLKVMEALGTDMIQIGPPNAEECADSISHLARDLAKLADICAEKNVRIAYENRCWAPQARTWKTAWEIVKTADRPNLGLCLNTFQIAAVEFGDPTTETGLIENIGRAELESCWRASLKELAYTVSPEKIYLLQISDAYKVDPPMSEFKDSNGEGPMSKWSNGYRALPLGGGYLPVNDVLRAVLNTRFRGWLSIEVYDSNERLDHSDVEAFAKTAEKTLRDMLLFS